MDWTEKGHEGEARINAGHIQKVKYTYSRDKEKECKPYLTYCGRRLMLDDFAVFGGPWMPGERPVFIKGKQEVEICAIKWETTNTAFMLQMDDDGEEARVFYYYYHGRTDNA